MSLFGPAIVNEGGHLLVLFMSWVRVPALPAQVLQSCPALCDSIDCSLPGSYIHGIIQARIVECVPVPSSRGSSQPMDRATISCIAGGFFTAEPLGKPHGKCSSLH